ncbi:MAG: UDP-2,3-diacylglucosamine diphosphatase [Gammaproteobacteria bacterium]|nr:UDP-2,3-diacylglucosamine diphosphatase [Gammaproteobacteria bacterium]
MFISDLHLDPARPRATAAFLDFLRGTAQDAARLCILGDLFEFWIGDDEDSGHAREVLDALAEYSGTGRKLDLMPGNRDFLVGQDFARRTGARLLPDPSLETLFGVRTLLMHGDLLCTDDHGYQRYRRIVHDRRVQALFLALPRAWRRAAGAEGRRRSRDYQAARPAPVMDVNPAAVTAALERHQAEVLVHGHTHRPGIHRLDLPGRSATRIVLGDWYEQGSVLRWTARGWSLDSVPFA